CPVCGEPVKRKNLIRHYRKVHPKRASTLLRAKPETQARKNPRIRRPRRILFYTLIGISIILVSVAAAEVVSVNTIRMHIHPQLSISIRGATACIFVDGQSMSLSNDIVFVDLQKIVLEIPPNYQPCSAVS